MLLFNKSPMNNPMDLICIKRNVLQHKILRFRRLWIMKEPRTFKKKNPPKSATCLYRRFRVTLNCLLIEHTYVYLIGDYIGFCAALSIVGDCMEM